MSSPDSSVSPVEATNNLSVEREALRYLQRIESNPGVCAFATVDRQGALDTARRLDADKEPHERPLHGMVIGIKDNIKTAGLLTTANSHRLRDYIPEDDAKVVAKLRSAGAIILGKTVTYEFAYGSPSFDLPFPPARNPWNFDHIPGGSSSGSAAAVASDFCTAALGTDSGGSIRSPAGYCGIVGFKPTYDAVDMEGIFPLSQSLDVCGHLTRSVTDSRRIFEVIGSPASFSDQQQIDALSSASPDRPLEGLVCGVIKDWYENIVDAHFNDLINAWIGALQALGLRFVEIKAPPLERFHACSRIVMLSEAYANYGAEIETSPNLFGKVFRDRTRMGAFVDAPTYIKARREQERLSDLVTNAMSGCDFVMIANNVNHAPLFTQTVQYPDFGQPYLTTPFSVTGHPTLAMPIGLTELGLPVGIQLAARRHQDHFLLRSAELIERNLAPYPRPALVG